MIDIKMIQKTIDYIEANLVQKIELDHVAENAFISKFHYTRIFHSVVGTPIMEYIRRRRLTEAAKELLETDKKIIDIALKYQFGSQEAFTRAFKKMFHISPMGCRKLKCEIQLFERINIIQIKAAKAEEYQKPICMAA